MKTIKEYRKDAKKTVFKNYGCFILFALLCLLITCASELKKAAKADFDKGGEAFVFSAEDMKQKDFWIDLMLLKMKYRYDEIHFDQDFQYEPSEAGKKLSEFMESHVPIRATIDILEGPIPDNEQYYKEHVEISRSVAKQNAKGFPLTMAWVLVPLAKNPVTTILGSMAMILFEFLALSILSAASAWAYLDIIKYERGTFKSTMVDFLLDNSKAVGICMLRDLKVLLWSLLLIVPGIIKGLDYLLVPYLIREYPRMDAKEALRKSTELMKGNKKKLCLLYFTYFGRFAIIMGLWLVLQIFFGRLAALILAMLFMAFCVHPYMNAITALYYAELTKNLVTAYDEE